MAPALRTLGWVAAILLLAGPVLAGGGIVYESIVENTALHCQGSCNDAHTVLDAGTDAEVLLGIGLAVGGAGLALLLAVLVQYMVRQQRG